MFFQFFVYLFGDWFDYWKISDKEVMFYLVDVFGYGVISSLLIFWMVVFYGCVKILCEFIKKFNGMLV